MQKSDILEYYNQCTTEVEMCYSAIKSAFTDTYVEDLMRIRGYIDDNHRNLIEDMEIGYANIDHSERRDTYINGFYGLNPINFSRGISGNSPKAVKESFLVTKQGHFLLDGRFIIPVEDIKGNYVALIGYYPDKRKYITAATPFFSKEAMFFNFRQAYELSYAKFDGFVIVVEGIFDCLSLRALGLPCIATMGATVSPIKGELLKYFNKVLGIPDNDKVGRRSLDRNDEKYGWKVPNNTTMLKFKASPIILPSGEELKVKDMDNFSSWFQPNDVIEILLSYKNSTKLIDVLEI